MANSGTLKKESATSNVSSEKFNRFEKLLRLFPENDQKFLIKSTPEEFKAFLKRGGFPGEELLEARDSWISQGGVASGPIPQDQDKQNDNKDQHQHPQTDHPTEKQIRDEKIKVLESKTEKGTATENEAKELNSLRQEGRVEELEQKTKEGKITNSEKEELEKIKQNKSLTEKPKIKPSENKLWDQEQGTEPRPNTLTSQAKPNTLRSQAKPNVLTRSAQPAAENASTLWGPGTGFSEPASRPTTNIPSLNTQSLGQRLSRPSFRPQTRIINTLNRGVRSGSRFSRATKGAAKGLAKKLSKRAAVTLLRFLLTTPIGWVILGILALIAGAGFIIFVLLAGNASKPSDSGSCDTPVCYYVDGPAQVANGGNVAICYSVTVIVDTSKQPNFSTLTLFDTYSAGSLDFVSASGTYAPTTPTGEVDWILGNNPATVPTSLCAGTELISPKTATQKAFYFNLNVKTKTSADNTTVENAIGIR